MKHLMTTACLLVSLAAQADEFTGRTVYLTAGNDRYAAGRIPTRVWALAGNDRIFGGAAPLVAHGGTGNDSLAGGPADDWLSGGYGTDYIDGGGGSNTLIGGPDDDVIGNNNTDASQHTVIDGGPGADNIIFQGNAVIDAGPDNDQIQTVRVEFPAAMTITTGPGADYINFPEFDSRFGLGYVNRMIVTDFDPAGGDTIRFASFWWDAVLGYRQLTTLDIFAKLDSTHDGVLDGADAGGDALEGISAVFDLDGLLLTWAHGAATIRFRGLGALPVTALVE